MDAYVKMGLFTVGDEVDAIGTSDGTGEGGVLRLRIVDVGLWEWDCHGG